MPLSRAEIQKRYRENKKKESGSYAKKERERKRKSYIPVALLSDTEAKKRRKETLKRVKRHNEKKKEELDAVLNTESVQTRSNEKGTLTIKLDFKQKRGSEAGKRVICNELEKAEKQIKELAFLNAQLKTEKKRIQKRLERARQTKNKTSDTRQSPSNSTSQRNASGNPDMQSCSIDITDIPNPATRETPRKDPAKSNNTTETFTPNTKANMDLRDAGLTPKRHTKLKKKLLQFHVLNKEIKATNALKNCKLKIAKKYKCVRAFKKMLGISRKLNNSGQNKKESSRSQLVKFMNSFNARIIV
ncbi:hypothetical protein DPMN_073430 [Dreissena polymorpha]|uniref:Uncharacterized protein n=1 Tax=Dreissena polymorpha TaxID=45954 RepID=A0A9D4BZ40_DREPO|nr:hypothetical protein DPMN_073430 [Dreissena polymorpha]